MVQPVRACRATDLGDGADGPGDRILDVGTGTGIVPAALPDRIRATGLLVGCDRAVAMVERARTRVSRLQPVVADAAHLPFSASSFDIVTASFVLSHVKDHRLALLEMRDVLAASGHVVVTNWAAGSDPCTTAWNEHLATVISQQAVARSLAEVAPSETYLSEAGRLEAVLAESGFRHVNSGICHVDLELTVEEFVDDRELSSAGRLALHLLGTAVWTEVRASAIDRLRGRFGAYIAYHRSALIATGRKP